MNFLIPSKEKVTELTQTAVDSGLTRALAAQSAGLAEVRDAYAEKFRIPRPNLLSCVLIGAGLGGLGGAGLGYVIDGSKGLMRGSLAGSLLGGLGGYGVALGTPRIARMVRNRVQEHIDIWREGISAAKETLNTSTDEADAADETQATDQQENGGDGAGKARPKARSNKRRYRPMPHK